MTKLFTLHEGSGRLVISVPHAGVFIPPDMLAELTPAARALPDTDWFVDRLVAFAPALNATLLVATHSRIVVDLNRSPSGGLLYPGQAETTICPTETFAGTPHYAGAPPGPADIALRVAAFWQPYHDALRAQLGRVRALHGSVRLLDAHSICGVIPRLFAGQLPDLNFGTNGGVSADAALVARATAATAHAGFSQVLDGRFRGGHITRHYGDPAAGMHAIQLEIAQSCYVDVPRDTNAGPPSFVEGRAARLIAALRLLTLELLRA